MVVVLAGTGKILGDEGNSSGFVIGNSIGNANVSAGSLLRLKKIHGVPIRLD